MQVKQVVKLSPVERLWYWIRERESIRLKREAGEPKPWTNDPILQRFRFCNVRRMDDRVSHWLLENWYRPNYGHKNMVAACTLARFINLPSSLEAIGFPKRWDPERIKRILRARRDTGEQVFNGAYMVRGNNGIDKIECVVNYYVQPLVTRAPAIDTSSFQRTWEALREYYGFGSFMAGQVTADLRWGLPGRWQDAKTWAPMGPGSKRGANCIYNEDIHGPLSQEEFEGRLEWIMEEAQMVLPQSITNRLEAIDYQNCLCEIDKYSRVLLKEGKRPKSRYPGV